MTTKRPSKDSQGSQKKPSFQEPPKEDDKKSVQNSQLNESKDVGNSQEKQGSNSKFDMPTMPKFQSLQLREYFDAKLSAVLLEGLKEIGRVRPENPTKFLGEYLIKQADSK